jgi:DNA-binding NarL/FixJ family response regulator
MTTTAIWPGWPRRARGYLLKNEAPGRIVERCGRRTRALSGRGAAGADTAWQEEVARLQESLTAREREVLRLIVDG